MTIKVVCLSSRDLRHGDKSTTSPGSRYRLVTGETKGEDKLQIVNVRASDAGLYTCLADFAASPAYKTHVQLAVIGKPLASLSWWTDQRFLKNTLTPLSEHRVRGDLIYGPLQREDHGRVFSCLAKNNEIIAPLSIDITIDMYLPPDLVSLRSEGPDSDGSTGRVRAGEALSLQCRVLGARPLPPIVWRLADNQLLNLEQKITMEPSQRLVVSDIQLTIDRKYDESHITCCAPAHRRNSEQFVCAQPLPLTVLYPPILEIVVTDADVENNTVTVIKGSNLSLACSYQANPDVYELLFFHKEDMIVNADKDSKGNIQQFLEIKNVTEADGGEYACVANNNEGSTYSEPINIDIIYPSYCEDDAIMEYGVGANEAVNLTCNVKSNPAPKSYRWILVNEAVNISTLRNRPHESVETEDSVLLYQRPNETDYSTIFCWGQNDVPSKGLIHTPCTFLVTGETIPRPPTNCEAKKNSMNDIIIACEKGHDGGLPQFMIQEPSYDNYKFVIIAFNDKGESQVVEVDKDSIVSEGIGHQIVLSSWICLIINTTYIDITQLRRCSVRNITTLALALCGGVALVALAACGLVLCTYERSSRLDLPRDLSDPPLCAYNTEESNCETYHDSDEGSECNVRRTDSFRRAVSRHSSKNFDVRRTSSFHSARYMHDMADQEAMNTFYTMPRKMRHKLAKELSDEASEITQNSDGFSLPPPPDEFGTYRAGTRIKDIPTKTTPTYTTVIRKNSTGRDPTKHQQYNNAVSTMNTVGLPTVSGGQHSGVYSYPDDEHHPSHQQVNTNPFDEDSS
ncbi:hypothetical protein HF086_012774 [Spodoptera exigua]|uniref:Ig-like domain-containing protein n=1 Tax=Spodoptera exigua TaxID=7107 RepID=A0A922MW82_SPOEX|nr:hypothetical protein HF086_012774 [Spodoptera exigua]